jgi:hypothetical protein
MSVKELQQEIIDNMRHWRKIENGAVASTGRVIEKTENPLIRLVMEIIQRDSQFHYRVQEFIADSLESKTVVLNPDELGNVWDMIEKHIEIEKETVKLAQKSLDALKGKKMLVQEYLLNYLLEDENKHNKILSNLEAIKRGMYPYA